MPKFISRWLSFLLIFSLLIGFLPTFSVQAQVQSCTASVTPNQVNSGAVSNFIFPLINTSASTNIAWIQITVPNSNFTLNTSTISGWTVTINSSSATFTGGTILAGGSKLVVLRSVQMANVNAAGANWNVLVSDDPTGLNPTTCTGNLNTQIGNPVPPQIGSISVSSLTSSTAKISWITDTSSDSKVNFGLDSSYGQNVSDPSLVTNHLLNLTNLQPDTGYHFQVVSSNADGSSSSADNTFLTASLPSSPNPTEPIVNPSPNQVNNNVSGAGNEGSSLLIQKKNLVKTENQPPTAVITTDLSKPFADAPNILGTASDSVAVFAVEYSIDGGRNWLPVDKSTGLRTQNVTYSFTPKGLSEGNYQIIVRATDTSGNIGLSEKKTLVIDRLPPIVGAGVISIGPQILKPNQDGIIATVVGIDQKLTVSSVGGAIGINIVSVDTFSKTNTESHIFALSYSDQTGLWSGVLSFSKKGLHNLSVEAIDGAGNKTKRDFGKIYAIPAGQITDKDSNKQITQAKITLYYLEPDSNFWVVWDATSYGQDNPQTIKNGQFSLFAPNGKYYLEVVSSGYKTVISNTFDVEQTMPITQNISLEKETKIGIGMFSFSIPSFTIRKIDIKQFTEKINLPKTTQSLENKYLPSLNLERTNGEATNSIQLSGKPTLISFVSTWSPSSQEQFQILDKLQKNQDLNISPIAVLESSSKLNAYKTISGLNLDFLVDPDGTTVNSFGYQSMPTHYFVDRKGVIKKIVVGVLSEGEILDSLGGI